MTRRSVLGSWAMAAISFAALATGVLAQEGRRRPAPPRRPDPGAEAIRRAEEFIRAGAVALESAQRRHEAKLARLRAAIDEGDASGLAEDSSLEGVLGDIRARRERSPAIP